MKSFLLGIALLGAMSVSSVAQAENWLFMPSYYSHDPVTQVRIGRQYAPGPVYTRPRGEYIRTGYRNLRSTIILPGQTYDQINAWESWVQGGAQF